LQLVYAAKSSTALYQGTASAGPHASPLISALALHNDETAAPRSRQVRSQLNPHVFRHQQNEHGARTVAIWQRGFSELRVEDRASFEQHRSYISENPVKAGLVESPEQFPYCFRSMAKRKAAAAKAAVNGDAYGPAEAVP
jgi:hypothetical protein